jgi:bacteriocin-like protein
MKELSESELIEINGGNPEAYNAGHAVGDFVQGVLRGVLMLIGAKAVLAL